MKITKITRSFSKTIQEKDYEPVKIEATYEGEISKEEEAEELSKKLYELAMNDVGMDLSEAKWEKWTNPQKVARKLTKDKLNF